MVDVWEFDENKNVIIIYYNQSLDPEGANTSKVNFERIEELIQQLNKSSIFEILSYNDNTLQEHLNLDVVREISEPESESEEEVDNRNLGA